MILVVSGCAHSHAPGSVSSATTPDSHGWRLLKQRCQNCHVLPDPRTRSPERWAQGIARMRKRLNLPNADWDTLLALVPNDSLEAAGGGGSR
jgi:CxxC motif-containing protein (DUF1111 family)